MVLVPLPPKRRTNEGSDLTVSAAVIWVATLVLHFSGMAAVGFVRVIAPWAREDCQAWMHGLSVSLKDSLKTAVAYRKAGTVPLYSAQRRSSEAMRPRGRPGASQARRKRR